MIRGSGHKLEYLKFCLNIGKENLFPVRVIRHCNRLSREILDCLSLVIMNVKCMVMNNNQCRICGHGKLAVGDPTLSRGVGMYINNKITMILQHAYKRAEHFKCPFNIIYI